MSRRLFFTRNRPANVDNHYVVGSGVGSKSRFVRSALRRRSSNNAQGKPCCFPMPKTRDDISATVEEKNNCTGGMVWKECGSACTRTCSEPEPLCTKQCVAGCECPQGQVLEGGQCVDVNTCEKKTELFDNVDSTLSHPTCVNNDAQGHCAKIDDKSFVAKWQTTITQEWAEAHKAFGIPNQNVNALFSALDAAKAWILSTDGEVGPTGGFGAGGCGSCAAAVAVALQEGGNQVGPGAMNPPTQVPQVHTDPTFSSKGDCGQLDKCQSGGMWQVSNAWITGGGCPVCEQAGCTSILNPLCAARIALFWTKEGGGRTTNAACKNSKGTYKVCSAKDLNYGVDPSCMLGPFCLGSAGWNSPPCLQMYRQASATSASLPYCRQAINACNDAAAQLQAAGWKSKVAGSCDPAAMKGVVDIACAGHTEGGNWVQPSFDKSYCTCNEEPCLRANDKKFDCIENECIYGKGNQTYLDCLRTGDSGGTCGGKPGPPHPTSSYSCNNDGTCISGNKGPFTTQAECGKICKIDDISQCNAYGDYLPYSRNNSTNKFCCNQNDYHFDTDISGSGCNATASACYVNTKPTALCPGTDMSMCSI